MIIIFLRWAKKGALFYFSPFHPKDTSLPVGAFVWTIENLGLDDLDVSIMLTFQNGFGSAEDTAGGLRNEPFFSKGKDIYV